MHTDAEATLIGRLRGGDTAALERLMAEFTPRVYRLASGITRNEADAEEVVQDVFLSVFRKIGGFEGRAALATWIYRITVNAALAKQRGKRFEADVPIEDHLPTFREDGHREGSPAWLLADWSQTPEDELLSKESRATVRRLIAKLPDRYRVVLLLRDLEGLSNEETAELLGVSVVAVKSRVHRARMALREQVTQSFVFGPGSNSGNASRKGGLTQASPGNPESRPLSTGERDGRPGWRRSESARAAHVSKSSGRADTVGT